MCLLQKSGSKLQWILAYLNCVSVMYNAALKLIVCKTLTDPTWLQNANANPWQGLVSGSSLSKICFIHLLPETFGLMKGHLCRSVWTTWANGWAQDLLAHLYLWKFCHGVLATQPGGDDFNPASHVDSRDNRSPASSSSRSNEGAGGPWAIQRWLSVITWPLEPASSCANHCLQDRVTSRKTICCYSPR